MLFLNLCVDLSEGKTEEWCHHRYVKGSFLLFSFYFQQVYSYEILCSEKSHSSTSGQKMNEFYLHISTIKGVKSH